MFILQAKRKILSILAKNLEKQKLNFSGSALFHMETRVSPKCFVNGCGYNYRMMSKILPESLGILIEKKDIYKE